MSDRLHNLTGSERQTLDWIRDWHQSTAAALVAYRASVHMALQTGSAISPLWADLTPAEVDARYDDLRRELDRLTMLNLVTSGEASITDDYFRRIEKKLRDKLSKVYRKWYKKLSEEEEEATFVR